MKIITEIRRENLLRLVDQCGSLAAISEAIGKKRSDSPPDQDPRVLPEGHRPQHGTLPGPPD